MNQLLRAKKTQCKITAMEPIRSGLRNIMRDLMKAQPPEEAVILAWPIVCGREVAARTQAVSFSEGRLSVDVADKSWQTQLASLSPRYVAAFAELLGPIVQSIRFQVMSSKGK